MQFSHFASNFYEESYSAIVDNLNLLYVAFTRAIDCLYGFCPVSQQSSAVSVALIEALQAENVADNDKPGLNLSQFFNKEKMTFVCGDIPGKIAAVQPGKESRIDSGGYYVSQGITGLHLKFHGENWLLTMGEDQKKRLNYGSLMHEIFESINTSADIPKAVYKMMLEGKISESDINEIIDKTAKAISSDKIKEWFEPGLKIMNEAEILTSEGTAKRPDRVIIRDDKVTVIDFKFGLEKREHLNQIRSYQRLLLDMGYPEVEAFLWYVDSNRIMGI
jgi:hypothetical protein